jgi:hypothetical protein
VAQLSGYLATHGEDFVQLQQYAAGSVRARLADGEVRLAVATDYPWSGHVEIEILAAPGGEWALDLRVPGWCDGAEATVYPASHSNGADPEPSAPGAPGTYLRLTRSWGWTTTSVTG